MSEPITRAELEKRIETGQNFYRICVQQEKEWNSTVDAFLIELQQELDSLTVLMLPPDSARDIVLQCVGKREFIDRFKAKMLDWLKDAQLPLDLPPDMPPGKGSSTIE